MEEVHPVPNGWTSYTPKADYTVTLFLFAWALLPVGFMVMMALFGRFEPYRLPLAAVSYALLVLAYWTGVSQRKEVHRESRVAIATAVLSIAGTVLIAVWMLGLDAWWWVVYGLVIGSVPPMYVALNFLAGCTAEGWNLRWDVGHPIPLECLPDWNVSSGVWKSGTVAYLINEKGSVCVLYGALAGEQTILCVERLSPAVSPGTSALQSLDAEALSAQVALSFGEE